jgi:signal transduction histidine kinase
MPNKLASQIISLILFMLLSTQILIFFIFLIETDFHEIIQERIDQGRYINQMVSAVDVIENSEFRDSFALNSYRIKFFVVDSPIFDTQQLTEGDQILTQRLREKFGAEYPEAAMQLIYEPQSRINIAIGNFFDYLERKTRSEKAAYSDVVILQSQAQLSNGRWVIMLVLDIYPYPTWIAEALKPLSIFTAIFILFSVIIVLSITSPLGEMAKMANRLGIGEKVDELRLRGPIDIQNVISAFNTMLKRVTNVNDHRARALAAISHDLRTPLTSMRLQAEFIAEIDIQENIFKKIDEMEQICKATVTFALQDSWAEKTRAFDIISLVDSICSDLLEQGLAVGFEHTEKLAISGRPIALKRAIVNLIKNGAEYGKSVDVSIIQTDKTVEIHIVDNGEGIPLEKMETLFSPFERLEDSRNRESGGLGLGMAIARSVVRSHGGEIELKNIEGKGLDAIIILPLSRASVN